jgi:hypothetical protein
VVIVLAVYDHVLSLLSGIVAMIELYILKKELWYKMFFSLMAQVLPCVSLEKNAST